MGLVAAMCSQVRAQNPQQLPRVTVDGEPVGPHPIDNTSGMPAAGTGLCGAFKYTASPAVFAQRTGNFPNDRLDFPQSVNDFMDGKRSTGAVGPRVDRTMSSRFDLSNQFNVGSVIANGDYTYTSGCPDLGCDFPGSSGMITDQTFGSRFRGFFDVKPEWAGQPMKFGFVADRGVAMWIYAMPAPGSATPTQAKSYLLVSHGLDFNHVRVTNEVIFPKAGLYPIEVLHASVSQKAILEMAVLFNRSDLTDIDLYADDFPSTKLSQAPNIFSLEHTKPDNWFQTAGGALSFPVGTCQQCNREYARPSAMPLPGGATVCPGGFFCNAAALCEYCPYAMDDKLCTPNCVHCMKPTPICWRHVANGPPEDSECVECLTEMDCEAGFACTDHRCVPRRPPAIPCPGSSPYGVGPDLNATADCSQFAAISPCAKDADCPNGQVCDIANTRCVDSLPMCRFDDKCGRDCVNCKTTGDTGRPRPFCLNGQVCVECRVDTDCSMGNYCLSGDCVPCTEDRHCGPSCVNCAYRVGPGPQCNVTATGTPFCQVSNGQAGASKCVACLRDPDCGEGNTCNPTTGTCVINSPDSLPPCPAGLFRKGTECVQCVSNSQCLCGSCDSATNTCVEICKDNRDCQGNQCCTQGTDGIRKCQSGRCAGTAGGALCGCSAAAVPIPTVDNNTIDSSGVESARSRGVLLGVVSMLLCALLLRRRQIPWAARQSGQGGTR